MSLLTDQNPAPHSEAPAGRRYWRSLEELERTPEFEQFLHREFPQGASEMLSPLSRRAFLNLMGASVALAGAVTGCRRPVQPILPYTRRPEESMQGMAKHYATSMERAGQVVGLIVRSYEGRPTKLEGHPDHPANRGGLDGMTQAALLELYDPDRSQSPLNNGKPTTVEYFDNFFNGIAAELRGNQGAGLAILSERTTSPSLAEQRRRIAKILPGATWHVWEPINHDNRLEGARLAFGRPVEALYDFDKANVIVALECDFLASDHDHLHYARQFARRRRRAASGPELNRLYAVESAFSLTGAMADHRLRVSPSRVASFALALAAELVHGREPAVPAQGTPYAEALRPWLKHEFDPKWVGEVARDMARHPGRSLLISGPSLPPAVQMVVHWVNSLLGKECAQYFEPADEVTNTAESIAGLVKRLNAGEITTLLMLGGNPVWDAPADLGFEAAMKKARHSVHLSLYDNETAALASWHFPRAHFLESWGDLRWTDGTICMVQPLIAPLFDGRTDGELLSQLAGLPETRSYDLVRNFHRRGRAEAEFDPIWRTMLHDGLAEKVEIKPLQVGPALDNAAATLADYKAPAAPSAQSLEVLFLPDPKVFDGRYSNNGWLQETPDPTTKLTWGNAVLMSLGTAKGLGLGLPKGYGAQSEEIVQLVVGGKSVDLPVWIVPGMADWTAVVTLGYGRTRAGRIGDDVGKNVYRLRAQKTLQIAGGAQLTKTGRTMKMACVQDHWAMEGRDLIRELVEGEPEKHDDSHGEEHEEETPSLWKAPLAFTERPQWGMTIDLSSCIGCNACMVACQSENNIPIVGKEHVLEGREMHWIRIDRYFTVDNAPHKDVEKASLSDPGYAADSARMVFQPMPCQHCENAPCEQVCPVGATPHSPDGLNEMTYNRCIGTRYCLNNCPFKVRRFNFFNYHESPTNPLYNPTGLQRKELDQREQSLMHMAANPYVTVRSRGVMEKCTFCVQRINDTKHRAHKDGRRPIRDGEVQTACQQTCPTEAIMFGDILDPESNVSRIKSDPRNYTLLDELNVRPRTSYLAKLRNPNPALKV